MYYLKNGASLMQAVKNEISMKFEFWELLTFDFTKSFLKIKNFEGQP